MDITFDDIGVHQPINDISGLALRGTDDGMMPKEVALIDERVGTHARVRAKVFKGIVGIERLHGNAVFLTITGGMQSTCLPPINLRKLQAVHELQDEIVCRMQVIEGKVPVDGRFEFGFVDPLRDPCDLANPNETAIAEDKPRQNRLCWLTQKRAENGLIRALESQGDRAHVSGDTHTLGVGDQPPRLNQQSQNIVYVGAERSRPYWTNVTPRISTCWLSRFEGPLLCTMRLWGLVKLMFSKQGRVHSAPE